MRTLKSFRLLIVLLLLSFSVQSQQTVVSGKVTEVETGVPVPFATVVFKGTTEGAITDFEGNFIAKTVANVDSLSVTYVGYIKKTKPITQGITQVVNFQLLEDITALMEVVVTPGENPAFEVMRNVIENKKKNDKRQLEAFDYESYSRTEFSVDNISDKLKNRKIMQKVLGVLDSMQQIAGEDGKPVLPMFMSEAISRFYYRKNPFAKHEKIFKTNVKGVGITDGTTTSQLVGSIYQEYNFYQNWLNIVGKEFASPIANGWKVIYEYELIDSMYVDNDFCYLLEFYPKQPLDLAFSGKMWITKEDYALKQIDAYVPNTSNLNFVEKIKVQQELAKTSAGPWLPAKNRVMIDIAPLTKNTAGLLARFYVSNKDFVVNEPEEDEFYMNTISLESKVSKADPTFWENARHDSLSSTELNVFSMIDSLKSIPVIRRTTNILKFVATGYFQAGKFDIGPYPTFVGLNDVEGLRLGMGLRTNINFSDKWSFGGYAAYGFDDERWKYYGSASYITNRLPWTKITYEQQREVEQVWLINDNIDASSLFYTFSRFGTLTQPFLKNKYRVILEKQLGKGLNSEFAVKHEALQPLFDFNYFTDDSRTTTASNYEINEASVSVKYGRDEIIVVNDNNRSSLGPIRFPLFKFHYAYGSTLLGGDFEYHKFRGSAQKRQKLGLFGVSDITVEGGMMLGTVPYSLLFNPIGNEGPFYAGFAYNVMDFFEFSADRYFSFRYRHSFEGFILNRIPLLKKLKWRLFGESAGILGSIRQENIDISQFPTDTNGNNLLPFRDWTRTPYLEVGYGVENILRFFSVQAFHRLTYLDNNARRFGLKFNVSIKL